MILSVDPGGTTGVAWYQRGLPAEAVPASQQILGGHLGFVEWFIEGETDVWTEIVCESFIPRPGALSFQPDASYIIGYLSMWSHVNGVSFKLQSPAQAKSFMTDAKLRAAGWWVKGQDHARDALRHLGTYLVSADPQGVLARKIAQGLSL